MKKAIIVAFASLALLVSAFILSFKTEKSTDPQKAENSPTVQASAVVATTQQASMAATLQQEDAAAKEESTSFPVGGWYLSFNGEKSVDYLFADHTYRRCTLEKKVYVCNADSKWYQEGNKIYSSSTDGYILRVDSVNEEVFRPANGGKLSTTKVPLPDENTKNSP